VQLAQEPLVLRELALLAPQGQLAFKEQRVRVLTALAELRVQPAPKVQLAYKVLPAQV